MKWLNSYETIGLNKEISYVREKFLKIDTLDRVPMVPCTFTDSFVSFFIYCSPMKKPRKLKYRTKIGLLL